MGMAAAPPDLILPGIVKCQQVERRILDSSEEKLTAVLPLVRFTRRRTGKSEDDTDDSGGGGDILKLKRKKKLRSSVAQEGISNGIISLLHT